MEFVGKPYKTEEEKNKILKTYDEFVLNKLSFLNDTYSNANTQLSYFIYYQNFFHQEEVIKNKDVMYFTTQEIKELLISLVDTKPASRGAFLSFINNYLNYCIERGYITTNNASSINTNDIKKINKKMISVELINLNDFYQLVEEVYAKKTYNRIILPVLFARYGILGEGCEDICNLCFEDIDVQNHLVRIKKDENVILLPVDEKFVRWTYKASDNDSGIVLRNNKGEKIESRHTIYNMFYRFFNILGIKRISAKSLRENRKLDLLGDIRKDRKVTIKDIEEIEKLISYDNNSDSRTGVLKLKQLYSVIFGDDVV